MMKKVFTFVTLLLLLGGGKSSVSAQVSYTLNEVSGDIVLRSTAKTADAAGEVKVPYHKYNLHEGTLYTKGVTSKEFNAKVTVEDGGTATISGYSDSKKTNVIFYVEGEDIEGATLSKHNNVLIRASNSSSAFAEKDLVITKLPAAKYRITVGCFDTAKAGNTAVFNFKAGEDVAFSITSNGNNLSEVAYDFMLMTEEDLVWKAGGEETKSIDYIFIQRMGEASAEVKKFNYTVNAIDEKGNILKELATGTENEGSVVKLAYNVYVLKGGELYKSDVTNKEYNYSFDLLNDNQVETITYKTTKLADVVFLEEGENIAGLTKCTHANTSIRSSNSASAYAADGDVEFAKLPAGTYKLTACIFDSAKEPDSHWIFKAGEEQIADLNCTTVNYKELASGLFTLTEETSLYIGQGGSSDRGIDFIFIQEVKPQVVTVGTDGWATFVAEADLDLSKATGLKAYTAKLADGQVTLNQVTAAPAGTALVVKAAKGDYPVAFAASAAAVDNDLKGSTKATTMVEGTTYYGLTVKDGKAQFAKVSGTEIAAGKAYLTAAAGGREFLEIVGETTAISVVQNPINSSEVYSVSGQRVAQPQKGLYIVSGKKVIIK